MHTQKNDKDPYSMYIEEAYTIFGKVSTRYMNGDSDNVAVFDI